MRVDPKLSFYTIFVMHSLGALCLCALGTPQLALLQLRFGANQAIGSLARQVWASEPQRATTGKPGSQAIGS